MTGAEAAKLIFAKYNNNFEMFYRAAHIPEIERRLATEKAVDAAMERIKRLEVENAKLEAALGMFEDGANWERYGGLSEPAEYVWRHDSDPRVLAQDACNKPDGGTK